MSTQPRQGTTNQDSDFLRERVALFGLVVFLLGFSFLVFRALSVVLGDAHLLTDPSMLLHLGGALPLLIVWFVCRRGPRSRRLVQTVETVGLIASTVSYAAMGTLIPLYARPELVVLLAVNFGVMGRAVFVPSTAGRTLGLTAAVGVPIIAASYFMYQGVDPALLPEEVRDSPNIGAMAAGGTLAWWSLTIALATYTSKVVYGLRAEIREVRHLGQYTLEEKLGEGGMGVVYRARHAMLRRPTAVKLLPAGKSGEETITRFEREVQLTACLTHQNTVTVFDYGRTPDGVFYYAMELLDGATLEQVVEADGAQPPARVAHVLAQVAGALAEAHDIGLIHRDIKPANIILCAQGGMQDVAKVLDFGLVKETRVEGGVSLTNLDTITGTPLYMSPEALMEPDKVDGRSDLYALGAVGYFLLTGDHVFAGTSIVEVCGNHLHDTPIPPSERVDTAIPEALEGLILQCLEKDPDSRPQSSTELREKLLELEGVEAWSQAEAKAWWAKHRATLRKRTPSDKSATSQTIAVDLKRR